MKRLNAISFRQLGYRFARLIGRAEPPALLLLAPALLFPSPRLILLMLFLPVLWLCAWVAHGQLIPRTPLDLPLLLLLVMVLVSVFATFDVAVSLGKITGVLLGLAAYYAVVRAIQNTRNLWLALRLLSLAGVALALVGIIGIHAANKIPALNAIADRLPAAIRGLPGAEDGFQPNSFAGVLLLFIPLQISMLVVTLAPWFERRRGGAADTRVRPNWMVLQAGQLTLTGIGLLLTQSREAWLGLAVALVCWLAWHGRRGWWLLALGLVSAAMIGLLIGPTTVASVLVYQVGTGLSQDAAGRQELWSRALYAIQDAPLTGLGFNVFRRVLPVLYPAFLVAPGTDVAHAHNHLLQVAVDLGLPGLVAYVALWLGAAGMLIGVRRRPAMPELRTIADGLAAGLLAHFFFSMTDVISLGSKVGLFFWLVLAIVAGLYRLTPQT